ncbi:alpha-1-antitrypsin [Pimephales promelas]|nr:alpha-1-antitrypsin [Pimephales promelas]KAG1927158.1 alpha-1-antitrypsin [Pimephales promelas]KAG1927159.1 alpha-1-antitrypsin [Pimephales promelas]
MFLTILTVSCFAMGTANRVYVHPFNLFSSENISCEVIQNEQHKPLETVHPLTPLQDSTEPDPRPGSTTENLKNLTQRTAVLAELQNYLGLRMYQALSRTQKHANTLLSPLNAFGALVTLYLGASKKTAISYQQLLGLNLESEKEDCAYFIDGHTVLRTLQAISAHVDESRNELRTLVWTFITSDADLSKDFLRGTQDFSDDSFVRAVDFSQSKDAEEQVNNFIQKTSDSKVKNLFKGVSAKTHLLFASSVHFKGNWKTAFQPEATTDQEFWTHENSSVKVPFMMHTGDYMFLNDSLRKCSVVKLGLSKRTYMLLALPHDGASLQHIEKQLLTVIPKWHRHLKEKYLELTLPKFSLTAVTDLRSVLSEMAVEKYLMGSDANFRRLSSKENFTVDKVLNKVVFEIAEGGSEVQNRTEDRRDPHKVMVNQPFFFAIVEGNSNAILMLGKIINPTT